MIANGFFWGRVSQLAGLSIVIESAHENQVLWTALGWLVIIVGIAAEYDWLNRRA